MSYRGVRALVLGASGFLGRWIARLLSEEGADLFVAARDEEALAAAQRALGFGGRADTVDATDPASVQRLLDVVRPAITFNAVGYGVDRSERSDEPALRINADFVEDLGRRLISRQRGEWTGQTLVHVGSALEYGEIGGDMNEASVCRPTTLYGRTKLAGTERLRALAEREGLRCVTARLFTLYGPGEHPGRLLPTLLQAARGEEPLDFTAGSQRRDFTYVEEAARALLALGVADGVRPGEVVNVATGRLYSVRAFIEAAMSVLEIPSERVRFGALPTRPEEMAHDDVTVERLRSLIGWTPNIDPVVGIQRAAARALSPPLESW